MKRVAAIVLLLLCLLSLVACGKSGKVLHCIGCGKEVTVDSSMDEDSIILCEECSKKLYP